MPFNVQREFRWSVIGVTCCWSLQMIKDVQMDLSRELLNYENGIRYKKLRGHWWDKYEGVKSYFYDKVGRFAAV